jgi:SAM-dependent methyltransferase
MPKAGGFRGLRVKFSRSAAGRLLSTLWFRILPSRPVSRQFAFDRGTPIDRYFIGRFLQSHAQDVRGRVLEVGDCQYTRRYGGGKVARSDVLHAVPGNPAATIVGDLATGRGLVRSAYDCIILTQTLHVIYDVRAAVKNLQRALKPGGVALISMPAITQISRFDADRWGDFWRMTPAAGRRLLEEAFPRGKVDLTAYGSPRLAVAFLYGLAAEDIPAADLAAADPDYPLLFCIRAQKERPRVRAIRRSRPAPGE